MRGAKPGEFYKEECVLVTVKRFIVPVWKK